MQLRFPALKCVHTPAPLVTALWHENDICLSVLKHTPGFIMNSVSLRMSRYSRT